jgi:hypothetical protein
MADAAPAPLSRLLSGTRVLALVGLAKNTGKTVTLAAILAEHAKAGRRVGVTSIGRDGEEHDVIDARISKPRIVLQKGSLVASTGALIRASGVAHERLAQTGVRTPLGEVIIARLAEQGAVEVAGPSAAEDVREVGEEMIGFGAEHVLIDGSIDRRAAASPAIADGLVMATGAVLAEDIEAVVAATKDAVDLLRLPVAGENAGEQPITVARRLALDAEPTEIATLLREHPQAMTLRVEGALGERFLEGIMAARTERAGRELRIVVGDPTKVFLSRRGPGWYRGQGLCIEVLQLVGLKAITINPIAPQSHRFDSQQLRELIEAAIPDVPVLDVLDPSYLALAK